MHHYYKLYTTGYSLIIINNEYIVMGMLKHEYTTSLQRIDPAEIVGTPWPFAWTWIMGGATNASNIIIMAKNTTMRLYLLELRFSFGSALASHVILIRDNNVISSACGKHIAVHKDGCKAPELKQSKSPSFHCFFSFILCSETSFFNSGVRIISPFFTPPSGCRQKASANWLAKGVQSYIVVTIR